MCGIGGFSLSKKSSINPRKLSNALLNELEIRGNQASGFGFQTLTQQGAFKLDKRGSQLPLGELPKSTRSAILHTRYATHGSLQDMRNNHPISSPDGSIDLVHNGVIYNHDLIRTEIDPADQLPDVDTSVVPAILEKFERNYDKLNMLDGDAALAWLDRNDIGTLRVARVSHSPLYIGQLKDGSFVFASTQDILERALKRLGLKLVYGEKVPERTLLTIRRGRLDAVESLPETDPSYVDNTWYDHKYYRNLTSGNVMGSPSYDSYSYTTPSGSNITPKHVSYQSAWGRVVSYTDNYPVLSGFTANEYGEYFDEQGQFFGYIEDLYEMGYITNAEFNRATNSDRLRQDEWLEIF